MAGAVPAYFHGLRPVLRAASAGLVAVACAGGVCLADSAPISAPEPIKFVALGTEPVPMGIYQGDVLAGGIVKDLGDAIAARLNTTAIFVPVSRKRVDEQLGSGTVDAICNALPDWYGVKLNWSAPLISNANLVMMRGGATAVSRFGQLRGRTIGGVHGYVYPDLDVLVGGNYARDDAPTVANSIWKLKAGRVDYAIVDQITLDWEMKKDGELRSFPTLLVRRYQSQCGFSPASKIPFARFTRAIDGLIKDGTIDRIMARYR